MRRATALLLLPLIVGCRLAETAPAPPEEPGGMPYRTVENPGTLGYLLHLPDGYPDSRPTYPLLFFLHGIVQKGNGSAEALEKVAEDGPFRAMRDGAWDASLPFVVVGPQSGGLQPWWRGEEVRKLLDHVMSTYRIDPRRRYVTGISMGGRSAWWLARNFSDEFAALVPVSGWAGDVSQSCDSFREMGVWAFHGDRDPLIRLTSGRKPIDDLNACTPELSPPPRLTVLTDAGHGQWTRVYENQHEDRNQGADGRTYSDIYRWMLSFER